MDARIEIDPSLPTRQVAVAGGRRLRVAGADTPSVLYDAGAFGIYADGANVVRALTGAGVPAVAYTRAGLSGSDPVPQGVTPSPRWHAEEMASLLGSLGADGPVVLIGHSMAGLRLCAFAHLFPERTIGLVLVDAMIPDRLLRRRHRQALRLFATSLRPVERVLPAFCRMAEAYPNAMRLTGRERADKLASVYSSAHLRATRAEVAAAADARPLGTDHGRPMVLMPAGRVAAGTGDLARRTGARLVDMSAWGHASVLSPVPAEEIARQARRLLRAC